MGGMENATNLFKAWTGDYEKKWYDIRLLSGEVIESCWPNAGCMNSNDGSGRSWKPEDGIEFRLGECPYRNPITLRSGEIVEAKRENPVWGSCVQPTDFYLFQLPKSEYRLIEPLKGYVERSYSDAPVCTRKSKKQRQVERDQARKARKP